MSECKCFDEILAKVTENLKGQVPESERESFEASWENQAIVVTDDALVTKIGLPVRYEYRRVKKSGEPYKAATKGSVNMMMSYCPFCGTSLKDLQRSKEQAA